MRFEFFWWDPRTDEPVTRRLNVADETVLQCFWDAAKELFVLPTPLNDDELMRTPYSETYLYLFGGGYPSYTRPIIREREAFNEAIFASREFRARMRGATVEKRARKNLPLEERALLPLEWRVGDSVIERWCWEPAVMQLYAEYLTQLREYWTARWMAQGLNVDERKAELGWEAMP